MRKLLERAPSCLQAGLVLLGLGMSATIADAQVFELRRTFERFENVKILVGGSILGPVESQLEPTEARTNIDFDLAAEVDGSVSIDYWQLRAGIKVNTPKSIAPFIFWNPVIGNDFGGENSRWSGSIGFEGLFASVEDYNPQNNLQADNGIFSPANSFSLMVGYWFGEESGKSLMIDTTYLGRGFVDTMNYRTPPLDTNSYIRGRLLPSEVPGGGNAVRYSSRNGFSAGLGLGTGKYAGSGPISKFLNFLYPAEGDSALTNRELLHTGLNPMLVARYRFDDWIGELDVAGEDVNVGVIYRGVKDFDFELGAKYLEHLLDRSTRGPNRSGFFLGVRYAPPFEPGYDRYEIGDQIYNPSDDSDGDGLPDGFERNITLTDPTKADTDGDGLPDGVEVYSYKSNPTVADSDGDGLSDGQEINAQRRTDPLRADTDEDGISDGEEVTRGQDPLAPGTGIRER